MHFRNQVPGTPKDFFKMTAKKRISVIVQHWLVFFNRNFASDGDEVIFMYYGRTCPEEIISAILNL